MDIWRKFVIVSCLVAATHSSSMTLNYGIREIIKLGFQLQPKSLARSIFSKLDKCTEVVNISSIHVSSECRDSLFALTYPFKMHNVKPYPYPDELMVYLHWTVLGKMLDSWAKIPSGIFEGNTRWLGSYQMCTRMEAAKYCLVQTRLTEFPISFQNDILWAACVPKNCSTHDITAVLHMIKKETNNKFVFPSVMCDKPHEYSNGNVLAIFVILLLLTLSVSGAIVETFFFKTNSRISDVTTSKETSIAQNGTVNCTDATKSPGNTREDDQQDNADSSNQNSLLIDLLSCFSFVKNAQVMTSTKVTKDSIGCVNGLRVIITFLMITCNMYIIVYSDDPYLFKKTVRRLWFMPVANGNVLFDIFFVLSGLLVSYLTLKWLDKKDHLKLKDLFSLYLHKYIRLTPSLAMLLLFSVTIVPFLQSGPSIMYGEQKQYTVNCESHWWRNLLYVNNFYSLDSNCATWTWSLAIDMQLYILSPFILYLMIYAAKKSSKRILGALVVTTVLITISFIIRACVIYYYKVPTVAFFNPSSRQTREKDAHSDVLHVKPYTRFGPYVVGMFLGYVIFQGVTTCHSKWRSIISWIGWLSSIAVGYLAIYGPFKAFNGEEFSDLENLTYGTFYSIGVAVSFAWLIYACHDNIGGLINTYLSWPGWIPLSRISYGAYLWHPMVCKYFHRVHEKHITYQDNIAIINLASVTMVSFSLGAISTVLLQIPLANLTKKFFSR